MCRESESLGHERLRLEVSLCRERSGDINEGRETLAFCTLLAGSLPTPVSSSRRFIRRIHFMRSTSFLADASFLFAADKELFKFCLKCRRRSSLVRWWGVFRRRVFSARSRDIQRATVSPPACFEARMESLISVSHPRGKKAARISATNDGRDRQQSRAMSAMHQSEQGDL